MVNYTIYLASTSICEHTKQMTAPNTVHANYRAQRDLDKRERCMNALQSFFFPFFCFVVVGFFFNSSLLSAVFILRLFYSLLTLLYGMMNSDERKLLGMSSSHFSLANLGIGYPNWTQNLPPKGYPVISIELYRAIFLYLMKFFSHGNVLLLSILLTISKQYCYVHIMYTNL